MQNDKEIRSIRIKGCKDKYDQKLCKAITNKSQKILRIKLTKEAKDLHNENYETLLKEIQEHINSRTSHIHGFED